MLLFYIRFETYVYVVCTSLHVDHDLIGTKVIYFTGSTMSAI